MNPSRKEAADAEHTSTPDADAKSAEGSRAANGPEAADDARSGRPSASAAEAVRNFPQTPGVYLFKDTAGRVIYVGKAKNLRARASSYFLKAAAEERRTRDWIGDVAEADFLEAESEVDALLMESRLIKDIQPTHNKELKDDKSFPYLEITTREDFPRVEVTREPKSRGTKLYGPFASAGSLRGAMQVLQRIFKFRTCTLDIEEDDERWKWFRPCLLASIDQCTAPCNLRISKEEYRKDIQRLRMFLDGKKSKLLKQLRKEMEEAAADRAFEKAAQLRDEIHMLETLDERGEIDTHVQPEVFFVDPKKGLAGLKSILKLDSTPRTIEGVDIAHLGGGETVASLVQFIDGLPFKPGYRRFKIREVAGVDDFRSIHEVVLRRFRRLDEEGQTFPDILLIDGGKGQLSAALGAFAELEITPPVTISLAKREEEIFVPGRSEPLRVSRHAFALRLLQYVRDEAHRFAQHYHHILRRKSTLGE
ncbi:MAG: excinuclease ABC subunit UvrC [Planctomycetota bacterium]|nr:MAG: excinuclease ABC subunit UvrC [Planctomycetota bacterium]REJ90308.1 MAG: excinuclease ABC subunit UvrC [Planctomycetota bacterium]REJ95623.1 MAG: excinuclease ABC subunit UvrC [Planctomycetota bacterium]REK25181.1 MAG: excinuclease ABC subunit UvrC [Planctomycetota bacterium]REK40951.1 MAG: excinuclease ABC subunit UvrC [Planctomycetota bacterium]